jgi:hypothetical protein
METTWLESTQVRQFSGSQVGVWTSCSVAKEAQMRVGKQLGSQGTFLKQAERQPKIRVNFLFLMG